MAINKAAFKAGFLTGLAESGISPSELEAKLEKQAIFGLLRGIPASLIGGASRLGSTALMAIPAAMLAGLATTRYAGRAVGQAAQTLTEPQSTDFDLARKEEERDEYKRLTEEAKRRMLERRVHSGV